MKTFYLLAASAVFSFSLSQAKAETVFFLMSGPVELASNPAYESYVISVSDPELIQQARDYLRARKGAPYLVPRVRVAAGADGINRNYADPDHPQWRWHVAEFVEWTTYDPSFGDAAVVIPEKDSAPSAVSQLISGDATHEPIDSVELIHYPLVMELSPNVAANVVNISTRGWVDSGERVLIAGFVIHGGTPRNIVIRGIGPSLARMGVDDPLLNPKLTVFHGSDLIAGNDDWVDGNFIPPPGVPEFWYAWLFPSDPRESAVRLSLPPGAYTVHLAGVGDTSGIGLVEVYDLDALKPR